MENMQVESLLALLKRHLPQLTFREARLLPASGQFNHVFSLDERWIFRFPKSLHVAADLAHELEILPRLAGRLPLPIPAPTYWAEDDETGRVLFMGYAMLSGQPLLRERFAQLQADTDLVARIAQDLTDFLLALHAIPVAEVGLVDAAEDGRAVWTRYYHDFRQDLFPHMRPDAQREVSRDFEAALADARLWQYDNCLIHGDLGAGNILFQDGRVSGVIDFSFCNIGDPAQDLGALLASYGEGFVERVMALYPALRDCLPRARFYCRQYALEQALFALRDNDPAEFEDGIAAYR
ncbi:MAG: phosphotransferase [Chloroflexi bacterium]|nr:phosphotransferase [Chloroflexota bacterium]